MTRNGSVGLLVGIDPTTHRIMRGHSTTELRPALFLINALINVDRKRKTLSRYEKVRKKSLEEFL